MPDRIAMTPPAIRDAASVILLRQGPDGPALLMGQRGAAAAFMPNKYVFPGGAVDATDADVTLAGPLSPACTTRLAQNSPPGLGTALAASAIRELWEETGLLLGTPGIWHNPAPTGWEGFAATGHLPTATPLSFVFRAITPPGRPRRFDARFFLADAGHIIGNLDDFSRASDELGHLHWVPLGQARRLNLPFITEVVLGEVDALLQRGGQPASVPFFDNSTAEPRFWRL